MPMFNFDYKTYITSSSFFSRLKDKTQMIRNDEKRLYHERSVHTSEVCSCALAIASKLSSLTLSRDLIIAMSLLHDIGHTPFGHAGEEAVNKMFISNDGKHYSETFPGLFKHNINSIKIVGEYLNKFCDSFALMDGILKHTSPFPKNYCLSVFKEENIIKSNFILRYFENAINANIDDVVNLIGLISNCNCKTNSPIVPFAYCHVCNNRDSPSRLCFKKCCPKTKLSAYVCLPYALTYEGAILFLADEISCFCSDLSDFYSFVKTDEKSVSSFIPLTRLNNSISIVKSLYGSSNIIKSLEEYIGVLYDSKSNNLSFISCVINRIKESLISSIVISGNVFKSGSLIISYDGSKCNSLLTLSNNAMEILNEIKASIYQDLHSIEKIKNDNNEGKQIIQSLIRYYYSNFGTFLDDFKHINMKSAIKHCSLAVAKVTSLDYSLVENWFEKDTSGICRIAMFLNKNEPVDEQTIIEDDTKRILAENVIKREIGYFVASLSEKQCFELKEKYKID